MPIKKVVIVGGGFAGLNAAKVLTRDRRVEVLLIDRRNHHLFQPLLYQVAMAGLSPADIAMPIRSIFRKRRNVDVLLAEVTELDLSARRVHTSAGAYDFDYLILACGAEHSYFGHDDWEDFAPGVKTLEQATEIRRRVLYAFEQAEAHPDDIDSWLTFVVVGGGPTGVELAGALGEITHYTLAEDFRHIDPSRARVKLIEAGPRLLSSFDESLSRRASHDLQNLGVEILVGHRVTAVTGEGVQVSEVGSAGASASGAGASGVGGAPGGASSGAFLTAKTAIWAAGVKPSPLNAQLGGSLDRQGRIKVTPELCLSHLSHVFAIGDQAHCLDEKGNPLPGLAPVAMQQGRFVARQILADLDGRARRRFHYVDKGQMATIGRKRAIAQVGGLRISGISAWLMWLFIHIYYLIGFKNRLFVLWNWTYSYFTYKRGARLITERDWHLRK
jgi:NADH dehydrogenase